MALITLLVYSCLLSALATLALGFYAYGKNSQSRVNRLFLFSTFGATYWALGEFFLWNAGSAEGALFWLKFSAFWPIVIAIAAHFVLALTDHPLAKQEKFPWLLAMLYLPAGCFSLIGLFTGWTHAVIPMGAGRYGYMALSGSPANSVESLFILAIMILAIIAGASAWRSAGNPAKKKQVKYVCIGIAVTIVFGALSGIILPACGLYLPNMVFIGIFLFSLCITYAITRYGLFTLSAETAVPSILRAMPDGLILMAMDGRIIQANASAARIFNTGEKNLKGDHAGAYLSGKTYDAVMNGIREKESFVDLEADLGNSKQIVVSIAGAVVKDPEGSPAGIVLIIRDISTRKQQQRALQVASEKITLVSRLTSHDINNLVMGLSGYLLLLEDTNRQPPANEYLRTSMELVEKISQNLRFSSEFLHLGTFEPGWQSLMGMIAEAENSLPHQGVTITTDVPSIEVYTDPLSVRAFYNLLENALHHGEGITTIAISAREVDNNGLVVVLEDDGGGVPDEEKDLIFQYGIGKHTGLGLYFARTILEVTGITIAETGVYGKGARFEIHFPAHAWRPAGKPSWEQE